MFRLSIVFALLAACGGGGTKQSDPTTTAAVTAQASAQLELGDMRLVDVNKNKAVVIKANGDVELDGMHIATVTPDGKISNKAGESFTLQSDGTITDPKGKTIDVSLSAEGVVKSGDKTISLDATGTLLGGNPDAPQMKVEGADTPGKRRTALFVLIALTSQVEVSEPPAEGSSAPPAVSPAGAP